MCRKILIALVGSPMKCFVPRIFSSSSKPDTMMYHSSNAQVQRPGHSPGGRPRSKSERLKLILEDEWWHVGMMNRNMRAVAIIARTCFRSWISFPIVLLSGNQIFFCGFIANFMNRLPSVGLKTLIVFDMFCILNGNKDWNRLRLNEPIAMTGDP